MLTRRNGSQEREGGIIANILDRWNGCGRPVYTKNGWLRLPHDNSDLANKAQEHRDDFGISDVGEWIPGHLTNVMPNMNLFDVFLLFCAIEVVALLALFLMAIDLRSWRYVAFHGCIASEIVPLLSPPVNEGAATEQNPESHHTECEGAVSGEVRHERMDDEPNTIPTILEEAEDALIQS